MKDLHEPIFYAKCSCDTIMRKYEAADLPPKGHFHYHQGVFLSGVYKTWLLSKEDRYFDYIKDWVDSVTDKEGNILDYAPKHLDDIQPGILLYPLIERTGDVRYRKALDKLISHIDEYPRNPEGGFWHMDLFADQMWLDGLYMGGPVCAEYGAKYGRPDLLDLVVHQALMMEEKTRDEKTGLLYHAWDFRRQAEWADPVTGRSPEFWGRSIGWVPVALLDDLDFLPSGHPGRTKLSDMAARLLEAVCAFQSDEGRWYQVVDKGGKAGNWLENSCSCLFTAALCKAVRNGILSSRYLQYARKGYEGVIRSLEWEGQDLLVGNVCIGTGVGDYKHYCDRPVSVNDLHGAGAFLLMCEEAQQAIG